MEANASPGHGPLDDAQILMSLVYRRWDEWVPAARLLKYNETNLELAKTLKNASTASTSKSANKSVYPNLRCLMTRLILVSALESGTGGGTGTGATASSRRKDGRGTKRGRDEDDTNRRPDLKLNVPEILKVLLVDDWEAVTKNNQVRVSVDVGNNERLTVVH